MEIYIGIVGSVLCILALAIALLKNGFGDSKQYQLLNLFGGAFLLYYAIAEHAVPFIFLEAIWVLLPLSTLVISWKKKH
ncbi:MAG: hypothetical protein KGP29_00465 [Proteobacteria bacterium]|nr:hypothetical protein [Pseudomonadota bacterium]